MTSPTVRSLAKALNLSRTTVSDSLRCSPRVNQETARFVREAAQAAGYRSNPLASAVMSELRRSRGNLLRGVLAIIALEEPDRPAHAGKFFEELIRGARERAEQLGFHTDKFTIGPRGVPMQRLDTILQSRGIRGLILLPAWGDPDFSQLSWSHYAGVYTDYIIEHPTLDSVCCDHYRSMRGALQSLAHRGYKRPGLFLQRHQDERIHHRWEGSFLAFLQHASGLEKVPPLLLDEITRDKFVAWFRRHKPDVVLGHQSEVMTWMKSCGARIPATHGFFCLNTFAQHTPCAGLDQQPRSLGAHATEIVVAHLHRNEFGIPVDLAQTTIPARWVEGPTITAAPTV